MLCPFCPQALSVAQVVLENAHCLFLQQTEPVLEGSGLIIPRQHRETVFDLTEDEWQATFDLLQCARAWIETTYTPDGYNLGINVGAAAGQTVGHAHFHVIPRYSGDVEDPRGGIRWVVPAKAAYWRQP